MGDLYDAIKRGLNWLSQRTGGQSRKWQAQFASVLLDQEEMGTDIVTRASLMSGINVAAIADVKEENATKAVEIAFGDEGFSTVAHTTDGLNAVIEDGKVGVVNDANLLLESGMVDVVVEATGLPGVGAEFGLKAMERGKHLVMMNVEADITVGAYLKSRAEELGVVYSLGAGDEPSSCMGTHRICHSDGGIRLSAQAKVKTTH